MQITLHSSDALYMFPFRSNLHLLREKILLKETKNHHFKTFCISRKEITNFNEKFTIPYLFEQKSVKRSSENSKSHAYLLYVSECSLASKGGTP